ncbi:hypothetical protein VP01_8632g1 [Puccinia sorghi]|uniref:Uncharacterized protein n=1 Tax=Puccinia sorghi TaxID=27349 RepID=A0A0L6U8T8_9BASI|nr:hypothetical protein VP01_8632g1 [Puccinia sorghi]
MARRRLTSPRSKHSSQESIGTMPPLLSISKKGFRKANSTPSIFKNKDNLNPPRLLRSSIRKDKSIRRNKQGGKEKNFVCIVVGNMSLTLVSNKFLKTTNYPLFRESCFEPVRSLMMSLVLRFILFDSLNQPYRVLLDSGANVSFISLEFAKRKSLPLTDINSFQVYLVNSLEESSFWVLKKTKWTFHFSNFTSVELL